MSGRRKIRPSQELDGDVIYLMEILRRTWGVEVTISARTAYVRENGLPVCYVRVTLDATSVEELSWMYSNVPVGEGEYIGAVPGRGILYQQYSLLLRLYAQLIAMKQRD